MIDNVNNNLNNGILSDVQSQKTSEVSHVNGKSNPYATFNRDYLIDETDISKDALKLFEREKDIQKFAKMAISDINKENDEETMSLMNALFSKGVVDIDNDDILGELSKNKNLMDDILG